VKEKLFKALDAFLEPIRARRAEFAAKPAQVREIIIEGTRKGRAVAQQTMSEVRTAMKISYNF
jgi:tryptophanyl-tRNA synthetase